jgi:hypothetical protein
MINTEVIQDVKLIEGKFTPAEAREVVISFLEEKINFHKRHKLSLWLRDKDANTERHDKRIAELLVEKKKMEELLAEAQAEGRNLHISGALEVNFVK